MNIVSGFTNDLSDKVRSLIPEREIRLSKGSDHLDLIAKNVYGSYDYWTGLAIYNKVINATNLIDSGLSHVVLFKKTDYDFLLASEMGTEGFTDKLWLR